MNQPPKKLIQESQDFLQSMNSESGACGSVSWQAELFHRINHVILIEMDEPLALVLFV